MRLAIQSAVAIAVALALAIVSRVRTPKVEPTFRWLPGFVPSAMTDTRSEDAAAQLGAINETPDLCSTFDAQEIRADVASVPDGVTVLASVATGVVVQDARGRRTASAPLAECGGSADQVIALAIGEAWIGAPVIAVVFSSGGHRAAETDLRLFRLDPDGLTAIFSGELETRDGDAVETGKAFLIPGAVVYQAPGGPFVVEHLATARPIAAR